MIKDGVHTENTEGYGCPQADEVGEQQLSKIEQQLKEKNIYVKKTLQRVYDTENKKTKIIIDKPKTENSIRCIPLNSKIYEELNKIKRGFQKKIFF